MPQLFPALRRRRPGPPEGDAKTLFVSYVQALLNARLGGERARPWDVQRAITDGYERVVWVFRCVDAIATRSSSLEFKLRRDGHDVEDDPLLRLLNDGKANPLETGRQLRYRVSSQLLLSKAGVFVEATCNRAGDVVQYNLLPPGRTLPVPGRDTLLDHFQVQPLYGGPVEKIDPKRVRWIRKPHPTDPYSGTTPLEAAGLSVELDYFSRLYNANFLRNDGRPGGVLGVKGDLGEDEMDELERRFRRGPGEAGKLSVVAGDLTYVDTAARPREMHYESVARIARQEILMAFGTPESQLGNAADRTFSNADAEAYMYWTLTIEPHNQVVVSGFDEDSEDDLEGYLDTSHVEELQAPRRKEREEARAEFAAGLRSIWSYAQLAGIDDIADTPYTRALWVPATAVPIASQAGEPNPEPLTQPVAAHPPAVGGQPATMFAPKPASTPAAGASPPPAPQQVTSRRLPRSAASWGTPPALPAPVAAPGLMTAGKATHQPRPRLRLAIASKAAPAPPAGPDEPALNDPADDPGDTPPPEQPPPIEADDEDDDGHLATEAALIAALAAALAGAGAQLVTRTLARLDSPKVRKGTRHWEPDPTLPADTRAGQAPLDAGQVVDQQRWATTGEQVAQPLVAAAAREVAANLFQAVVPTAGPDDGDHPGVVATAVTGLVLGMLAKSMANTASNLASLIAAQDAGGATLPELRAAVQAWAQRLAAWTDAVATQVGVATVEGARYELLRRLFGQRVTAIWRSRHDADVRPTHAAADGQQQMLGDPFRVGEALLYYPGDPDGPPGEVRNCRCRLRYQRTSQVKAAHGAGGGHGWDPQLHPRDQNGRFVHVGAHVQLAGGGSGRIQRILHNGKVEVQGDNGKTVVVSSRHVSVTQHHGGRGEGGIGHTGGHGEHEAPGTGRTGPAAADIHGGGASAGHEGGQATHHGGEQPSRARTEPEQPAPARASGPPLSDEDAYLAVRNPQMTDAQEAAVGLYTTDDHYRRINNALRAGGSVEDDAVARRLQETILSSPPLEHDIQVWRGVMNADGIFGDEGSRVGQEFSDAGFGSTTSNPEVAMENFGDQERGALVRIRTPEGTHVIQPGAVPGAAFGEREREILLQAGTRYRVVGDARVTDSNSVYQGWRMVELEIVNG